MSKRYCPLFFFILIVPIVLLITQPVSHCAELDIWLISTRKSPRTPTSNQSHDHVEFWHLKDSRWEQSNRHDFLEIQSPEVPVVFMFHGNWTNHYEVIQLGNIALNAFKNVTHVPKIQLVLWSWPADRVLARIRPDIMLKASWSDSQALYVANLLNEFRDYSRVTLLGFSFGARISLGAIELLNNGNLADKKSTIRFSLLLCAPAVDQCWITANGRYRHAMESLETLVILYNSIDRGLKFYPLICSSGNCEALGFAGPPRWSMTENAQNKTNAVNMRNAVGKQHSFIPYLSSHQFEHTINQLLANQK